jgi:thiamine kinase-like enzyme
VHALRLRRPVLDWPGTIERYARVAGAGSRQSATAVRRAFAACRARPDAFLPCFCHNDPSPANWWVAAPGGASAPTGLVLLDWEYAAWNQPEFDLAVVAAEGRLGTRQRRALLAAWLNRQPTAGECLNLSKWLAFYRALAVLWQQAVASVRKGT